MALNHMVELFYGQSGGSRKRCAQLRFIVAKEVNTTPIKTEFNWADAIKRLELIRRRNMMMPAASIRFGPAVSSIAQSGSMRGLATRCPETTGTAFR